MCLNQYQHRISANRSAWGSCLALTLIDREVISRGLLAKLPLRSVARALKRSASKISREIRRNGGVQNYRETASDAAAWGRAHFPKSGSWKAMTISVARYTRYVMLAKGGNKDSHSVVQALIKQSRKLPIFGRQGFLRRDHMAKR